MVKWIFFDLGSTLINESLCLNKRINATLKQYNAPSKDKFLRMMVHFAAKNEDAYKSTVDYFQLIKSKWPTGDEVLYQNVESILSFLSNSYKLGIIAYQPVTIKDFLVKNNIYHYFNKIIISEEVGFIKPNIMIFEKAMQETFCNPDEIVMVGDRLDNDIIPAQKAGMKTIWIKHGYGGLGKLELLEKRPDFIINKIDEILEILS